MNFWDQFVFTTPWDTPQCFTGQQKHICITERWCCSWLKPRTANPKAEMTKRSHRKSVEFLST